MNGDIKPLAKKKIADIKLIAIYIPIYNVTWFWEYWEIEYVPIHQSANNLTPTETVAKKTELILFYMSANKEESIHF